MLRRSRYLIPVLWIASIILVGPGILIKTGVVSQLNEVVYGASDPVIATAGDIACDPSNTDFNGGSGTSGACRELYTSDLILNINPEAVLALGDTQYYCGGYQAFLQSYDPSWGRLKSITHPVVGNHEYLTSGGTDCNSANAGAAGYFNYFGSSAGIQGEGYYSFDIGSWHIIALNSNCSDVGGCDASSPQGKWLENDLANHSNLCTLAFWHIPLFSSGGRAAQNSLSFWQALYNHNADLILTGHDHIYERFAPQTPAGVADPINGIREFIVGTGGADHTTITTVAANSEVRNTDTFGVLKLTLHSTGYDWSFVPEPGFTFTDSGTGFCHSSIPDTTPPTTPTNLNATSIDWNQVSLNWTSSTDNIGVAGYQIFRNGSQIATSTSNSFVDTTVNPQTSYNYSVVAFDTPGNASSPSNLVAVMTTDPPPVLSFAPSDDTYIESDQPNTSFGSSSQIVTDNSPIRDILIKFTVSGVVGRPVKSAILRLYNVNGSPFGGEFHRVLDTSWKEGTATWNSAPTVDLNILASLGGVTANNWYEVDVTSVVTGDGTFSFEGISSSGDGAYYSSKEGTVGFAPQLVVTTSGSFPTSTQNVGPTTTPTPTVGIDPTSTALLTQTTTLQNPVIFNDDFENGDLANWTTVQGLVVQTQEVEDGHYAARETGAGGGATYANKLLSAPQADLYYAISFKIISQAANTVNLMKFRTAANASILSVSVNNLGRLSYRNDVAGTSVNSIVMVSQGMWQSLVVHLKIAGNASQIEVWYNGIIINAMSNTDAFGATPVGRIQLGENTPGLTYDIAFDDISATLGMTPTVTPTQTVTIGATPTLTPTSTPTATMGIYPTNTSTPTPTATPWVSPTPTMTATPTVTVGISPSLSPTPTPTATQTITPTVTMTFTPTPTPTIPPTPTNSTPNPDIFNDGFESGDLTNWTIVNGLIVQSQVIATGGFAARETSVGSGPTFARKLLPASQTDLYYKINFFVVSQAANTVNLMKLRTTTDGPILSLSINNLGRLSYRNDVAGTSVNSTVIVAQGTWQSLEVHLKIAGNASQIEVWYNGVLVNAMSKTDPFGTTPIGRIQLGENTPGLTYDIVFDDLTVSSVFLP